MKVLKFSLSKPKKIIFTLLLINGIAFFATQSIANKYSLLSTTQNENKNMSFIEKGWHIVNWSYNLLKYFKKPNTTDSPG